jgi:hypothetical protein
MTSRFEAIIEGAGIGFQKLAIVFMALMVIGIRY